MSEQSGRKKCSVNSVTSDPSDPRRPCYSALQNGISGSAARQRLKQERAWANSLGLSRVGGVTIRS